MKRWIRSRRAYSTLIACGILSLTAGAAQAEVLIAKDSFWEILNPGALANDPALIDPDFNTTFMNPATYNGPAFEAPQQALLGFGTMDNGEAFKTLITDPGSGNRNTVYVRQTFTTTENAGNLNVSILADDGGIMYIDGVEVGRINFTGGVEEFGAYTPGGTAGVENAYTTVPLNLVSLPAGTHTFAMSVHQNNNTSSDLGFNLTLNGTLPNFGTISAPATTSFSEPALNSKFYVRGTNPPGTELSFSTTGTAQGVTDYSGNKQFKVNSGAGTFTTEYIDLRNAGALTAKIDLRAYSTTASGFETNDFLNAFVEVSTDGAGFTKINFFDAHGDSVALANNALDLLESGGTLKAGANGPFTTFSVPITADIAAVRFGVSFLNDNASEFFLWDNIKLVSAQFPGDADGSGTVDFTDLGILLNNYNQAGTFSTGDFDGNGTVDFTDLGILLNNYNQSAPVFTISAPVPEPSSFVLAGLAIGGILLARRRGNA